MITWDGVGLWCLTPLSTTFNIQYVISLWSFLLEETGVPVKAIDKFYHTMLYWVHLAWAGFELTMLVAIGTDCIGSSKSNYNTTSQCWDYILDNKVKLNTFKSYLYTYFKLMAVTMVSYPQSYAIYCILWTLV